MKKAYRILSVSLAACLGAVSCGDYLNTNSPSVVDIDFVFSNSETANATMYGVYEAWRDVCGNQVNFLHFY